MQDLWEVTGPNAEWRDWWREGEDWQRAGPNRAGGGWTIRYTGPPEDADRWAGATFDDVGKHPELFKLDSTADPEWKPGDWNSLWWRFDADRDELLVRFPLEPVQDIRQGVWCETGFRLDDDDRLTEIPELRIRALTGGPARRRNVLNRLGLRVVNDQLPRQVRVVARNLGLGDRWERAVVEVTRPGRKGMSDAELVQWALRYVEALETDTKRPYVVLADRYPGWSDSALKAIVRRARKAGFLTEVGRGQSGGELTDQAVQILRQDLGSQWAATYSNMQRREH